jgi:hypothetical protein
MSLSDHRARRIFVSEVMERSSATLTIDTIYIDGALLSRTATTSAAVQSCDREQVEDSGIDDRRNDDGRFPGIIVIGARLAKS